MRWAKPLESGKVELAPAPLVHAGKQYIGTVPDEIYRLAGYLKVIDAEEPEHNPEYEYLEPTQDITEDEIRMGWQVMQVDVADLLPAKLAELEQAKKIALQYGVEVETTQGLERFPLPDEEHAKILELKNSAEKGEPVLSYEAADKLCRLYTAEEILAITTAAQQLIIYHTTYLNHIKVYAKTISDPATLTVLRYGDPLPQEYQDNMDSMMAAWLAATGGGDETPA